jgi:biuret amidohydrolase
MPNPTEQNHQQYVAIPDPTPIGGALPLKLQPTRTAVIGIDLHRGHLDPAVATMPLPSATCVEVVEANRRLFGLARTLGMPVIHVILQCRTIPGLGRENLVQPFKQALLEAKRPILQDRHSDLHHHNLEGSPQSELMPQLGPEPGDFIINYKRRMSSFYGTDLEILLRTLKIESVIITGVNTNTCVQCAAMEAYNRDLQVIVVKQCVASMDGEAFHDFALANIGRRLGWVVTLEQIEWALTGCRPDDTIIDSLETSVQ